MWRFEISHLPGSTNTAADAASRHPATSEFFATISRAERDSIDSLEEGLLASLRQNTRDELTLNWDKIARHTASDAALKDLLSAIQSNFDVNCPPEGDIRQYLPYRDGFYISDGVILYNDRVVIPPQFRHQVLCALHAAHQVVSAMERRAVFWPRMNQDIHNIRDSCAHWNRNAPSLAANPPLPSHPPTTPFEKIFADYFDYAGRHFLIVGDRLSGWSDVFGTPAGTTDTGANALFASFDHTLPLLECLKKFPQMVAHSLLPLSHRILCTSGTSNTASLPPTSPNPTAARRLQSKPLKDFSCPILALMGI